jgi:hypothetical protein
VKNPELESYVEAVESHLRARRGAESVLSPKDFNLVRAWYSGHVPLATVLVGIDRAFASGHDVTSLQFCRKRVEELVASGPSPPRSRPSPPAESVPLTEVAGLLHALRERLAKLRPGPRSCFEPPLRKISDVKDLIAVATRPNWEYLRGKLREIDDDVSGAVLESLAPADVASLRAEASRSVERLKGRVDDASLEDALLRYVVQRGREKLDLPRVSLV